MILNQVMWFIFGVRYASTLSSQYVPSRSRSNPAMLLPGTLISGMYDVLMMSSTRGDLSRALMSTSHHTI